MVSKKVIKSFVLLVIVLIMSFSVVVTNESSGFIANAASSTSVSFKSEPRLKLSETKETSVKLSWSKVSGATGYRLYKYNSKAKKWEKVKTTSSTSYTVTKLKSGTTYKFRLRAYKKTGKKVNWGEYSDVLKISTKPAAATNFKVSSRTTDSLKLSWKKVSGATGYRLYKYNSKTKKWDKVKTTSSTSYTVTKLKSGTTYKFRLRAYKKIGEKVIWGKYSDTLNTTTRPATVTSFEVSDRTAGTVELSWKKVSGATGYRIYIYNSKRKEWVKIKTTSSRSYVVDDLNSATTYKFRIRAYKEFGEKYFWSSASDTLLATTSPEQVKIDKIAASVNTVALEWNEISGTTGYQIEYSTKKDFSSKERIIVSNSSETSKSIDNLIGGKTYYIRIRAYKTVNRKNIYGSYSSVVSAKVKTYEIFSGKIGVYESKNLPSTHSYYDEYCPAWMSVYTINKSSENEEAFKKQFKATFGYEPEEEIKCEYIGKYQIEGYNEPQDVYRYTVEDCTYQLLMEDFYTMYTQVCDDGCPWTGFCVPYGLGEIHNDNGESKLFNQLLPTFCEYSGYDEELVSESDNFTAPYNCIVSGPYRTMDGKIIDVITWYFIRGHETAFNKDVECEDCGEHIPAGSFHRRSHCKKYQDKEFRLKWFEEKLK